MCGEWKREEKNDSYEEHIIMLRLLSYVTTFFYVIINLFLSNYLHVFIKYIITTTSEVGLLLRLLELS